MPPKIARKKPFVKPAPKGADRNEDDPVYGPILPPNFQEDQIAPGPICICHPQGRNYLKCPVTADKSHNCDKWLQAHGDKIREKVGAERMAREVTVPPPDGAIANSLKEFMATSNQQFETFRTDIGQRLTAIESKAPPADTVPNSSSSKRPRNQSADGARKQPRATAGSPQRDETSGSDVEDTIVVVKPDSLLRKGPLASHALSDAELLTRLLNEWEVRAVQPEWCARVADAIRTLRTEIFTPEADVLSETMVGTSTCPKRSYGYRTEPDAMKADEAQMLGSALRRARGWGAAMRDLMSAWASKASADNMGSLYLDSAAKVSIEKEYWTVENPRCQATVLGPQSSLPGEFELSQPGDLLVIGLHLVTIRPTLLEQHLSRAARALVAAFQKTSKAVTISYTAWSTKYKARPSGGGQGGRGNPNTPAPPGQGKRSQGRRGGARGGGGGGGSGAKGGGGGGPGNGGGGGGRGRGGRGYQGRNPLPPCTTCGRSHPGKCWGKNYSNRPAADADDE